MSTFRSIRSPSPGTFATTNTAFVQVNQSVARANASALATSLNVVIDHIPLSYRDNLRTFMLEHHKLARTFYRSKSTLRKLEEHQSRGTYPSGILRIHVPKFQFSKEYLEAGSNAMEGHYAQGHPTQTQSAKNFLAEVERLRWISS